MTRAMSRITAVGCAQPVPRTMLIIVIAGLATSAAFAQGDERVVVVKPAPGGTPVPVQPHEKVTAVTVVNLPGRGPVAVVRVAAMPLKPAFNIITPDGVSHPFTNGPSAAAGITQTQELQVINDPVNGDRYCVKTTYKQGATEVGSAKECFPQGSQYVPDPPQPPNLMLFTPDAVPVPVTHELLVLAALGIPDVAGPQVYDVPSGDFRFQHPGGGSTVHIRGSAPRGDLNCDGVLDFFDIDPFLLALFDANAYAAQYPRCDAQLANVNDDQAVDFFDIDPFLVCLFGDGCQ